jgi:hypothetical protein
MTIKGGKGVLSAEKTPFERTHHCNSGPWAGHPVSGLYGICNLHVFRIGI